MSLKAAKRYDRSLWALERIGLARLRRTLVDQAAGNILEIGIGTGINLPHYANGARITGLDSNPDLLVGAQARSNHRPIMLACADAHTLPFPADAFDTVVGSLVFCCIVDPSRALSEIRRVLRPSGALLLLEHVRGQGPISRRLTDWLHPIWFSLQGVCHLNRPTADIVRKSGFEVTHVDGHGFGVLQLIQAHPSRQYP